MSWAVSPTLMEIRKAVGIRLSVGATADHSPDMRDKLDEYIRQAVADIYLSAQWLELKVRLEYDLDDGQEEYDWPDNMDPGRVEWVTVVQPAEDGGSESIYELKYGIRPYEDEAYGGTSNKGLPVRYDVQNQNLRIVPAPDTESYSLLRVEGFSRPVEPKEDTDRIPLNKEAVIRKATAIGKADMGLPGAELAEIGYRDYIADLRPVNTSAEVTQMGGTRSKKFGRSTKRTTPNWREYGSGNDIPANRINTGITE